MGTFLKIFITILCISILLSIAFPTSETQFLDDGFFSLLLEESVNPLNNETEFTGLSSDFNPEWSVSGNQDSTFFQKFLDGLNIAKKTIITLINIAVVPIVMAIRMQVPTIVRILFFIPLALLYIISAVGTFVRGVNP